MSTEDDSSTMRLQQAEKGTGNTIAMTAAQLMARKQDLVASRTRIFKIVRLDDGQLAPQAVTMEYVENLPSDALDKKQFVIHKDWESRIPANIPVLDLSEEVDPMVEQLRAYATVSPEDRVVEVAKIRNTIDELRKSEDPPQVKAQAIIDAIRETFVINAVSLKHTKSEVTENERNLANEAKMVVNSVVALNEEEDFAAAYFQAFSGLSNGQTLNHIQRVFSMMISFLKYYNQLHQRRIGQSIRLIFNECYSPFYRQLFPALEAIQLTADNMIQLASFSPPEIKEYALGAFLHDIGKMANFDYFESDQGYDPKQIREHVYVGSIMVYLNYGSEHDRARLMAGDHHNALFHKDGYGITRVDRMGNPRALKEPVRCITASIDEYLSGMALGYLPTEMISVIDIFDAMTDASRTYKKPMSASEAVIFIIDKQVNSGKLDPILVDIFIDFLRASGQKVPDDQGFNYKYQNRRK